MATKARSTDAPKRRPPHKPRVPALVGRREAAAILGVASENLGKLRGMPEPLQDRIEGIDVKATPLYTRAEIEYLRSVRQDAAATSRSA